MVENWVELPDENHLDAGRPDEKPGHGGRLQEELRVVR
jgi:hypothetical protein